MIMKIFDFFVDSIFFSWFVITSIPIWTMDSIMCCIENINNGFRWVFKTLPAHIAFKYRIQRLFYPFTVPEYNVNELSRYMMMLNYHTIPPRDFVVEDDIIKWLNENVGKYRWNIIIRSPKHSGQLCFRHRGDRMGFKLRWIDHDKN